MSQYLPTCNFKWVKNIDRIEEKLMRIKNNSSTRYILETDLEYPKELHNISWLWCIGYHYYTTSFN